MTYDYDGTRTPLDKTTVEKYLTSYIYSAPILVYIFTMPQSHL